MIKTAVFVYKYIQSFLGLCDMDKCIDPNEVGELRVILTAELLLEAGKLKKRKVKPAKEPCEQSGDILSLIWHEFAQYLFHKLLRVWLHLISVDSAVGNAC